MYEYEECKELSLPGLRHAIARLEGKKVPPFKAGARESEGGTVVPEQEIGSLLEGVTGNVTFCVRDNMRPEFITIDVNDSGDIVASFFLPCEMEHPSDVIKIVSPHLAVRGARLIRCRYWDEPGPKMPPGWDFDLLLPRNRGTLSGVHELAVVLARTLSLPPNTSMDAEVVASLCHGAPESLVGLEEPDWLEVKSQGYDLDSMKDKIELAQDVSRFANSEKGGILAVGYRTKKNRNGELISKCTPVHEGFAQVARYRATIDSRIFPPIDGLVIRASPHNGGWVLTVFVPSQAEENKPFLVHGAIAGGKVEGAFISIVRRRGEASIPITGPAIHSMLSAGRSILHGKRLGP
ncbi:hypothetical protein [Streptomyces fodineus]|uniref:hypothetical protein n=1 Tax=Streptomyces fodineus TaxID=1904616 RepID=UPI00131B4EB3|nr:hypothetical protein [Streptomyces fodineus]